MCRKDGLPGTLLLGLLASAGAGALLGLIDAARLEVFGRGLEPHHWLVISVWYVLAAALLSLPFAFVCHLFCEHPRRWVARAPGIGAVTFAIAAAVNALLLPHLRHPVSIAANAAMLAGAGFALRRAASDPSPGLSAPIRGVLPALFLAPAALVSALGGPAEPPPVEVVATRGVHPPVLVLLVDTLRRDHMSLYGYERETTPLLDAFARDALVFDRARSPAPWTKPSIPSIYTGLHPTEHGVEQSQDILAPEAETIAELLGAGGYETLLVSANAFNTCKYRQDQGFDDVVDVFGGRFVTHWRLPNATALASLWENTLGEITDRRWPFPTYRRFRIEAPEINATFLEWMDEVRARDKPWFAFLHYMEPHGPYDPPEPWDRKFAEPGMETKAWSMLYPRGQAPFDPMEKLPPEDHRACVAAYDGDIAWWDHCFGELLAELERRGVLDEAVVVVVSDHGEGFWEHKTYNHCNSLHEELLRVPLVIRGPGVPTGLVPYAVSLESIPATLLDLAGFRRASPPAHAPAPALLPLPTSDRVVRARGCFQGVVQQMTVADRTKWILSTRGEEVRLQCFDLRADPGELEDLEPRRREEGRRIAEEMMSRATEEYERGMKPGSARTSGAADDDLRGLGYLK